jgi:hypothetical protein
MNAVDQIKLDAIDNCLTSKLDRKVEHFSDDIADSQGFRIYNPRQLVRFSNEFLEERTTPEILARLDTLQLIAAIRAGAREITVWRGRDCLGELAIPEP